MPESPSIIIIKSHDDNRPLKKTRREGDDIQFKLAARPAAQPGMPIPSLQAPQGPTFLPEPRVMQTKKKKEIADIIAAANAAAEAETARLAAAAAAAAAAVEPLPEVVRKKPKAPKKSQSKEERDANKEKRLLKLVGAVVVRCMSKYSGKIDNDVFKKYAKEVRYFFLPSFASPYLRIVPVTRSIFRCKADPYYRRKGEEIDLL